MVPASTTNSENPHGSRCFYFQVPGFIRALSPSAREELSAVPQGGLPETCYETRLEYAIPVPIDMIRLSNRFHPLHLPRICSIDNDARGHIHVLYKYTCVCRNSYATLARKFIHESLLVSSSELCILSKKARSGVSCFEYLCFHPRRPWGWRRLALTL